jgi:hypothetical protein
MKKIENIRDVDFLAYYFNIVISCNNKITNIDFTSENYYKIFRSVVDLCNEIVKLVGCSFDRQKQKLRFKEEGIFNIDFIKNNEDIIEYAKSMIEPLEGSIFFNFPKILNNLRSIRNGDNHNPHQLYWSTIQTIEGNNKLSSITIYNKKIKKQIYMSEIIFVNSCIKKMILKIINSIDFENTSDEILSRIDNYNTKYNNLFKTEMYLEEV